jgi:hypothetical protein
MIFQSFNNGKAKDYISFIVYFKIFDNFKILHDKEIERIKNNNDRLIGSMVSYFLRHC